jgi:hypothetical protein
VTPDPTKTYCANGCGRDRGTSYGDVRNGKWYCQACLLGNPKLTRVLIVPRSELNISHPISELENEEEREWREKHGPIQEFKKRFLPYAGWTCPKCGLNLNNKPLSECDNEKHQQHYAKRHPRYEIPSASPRNQQ